MGQNSSSYWEQYWENFLEHKKLKNFVNAMNEADQSLKNKTCIEDICHRIYEDYLNSYEEHLEEIRTDFLKMLKEFRYVHLQTSRIKKIDSLLEKVIIKRYKALQNTRSAYAKINGENYKDIITDLIGIRIILNYRGNWRDIHKEVLNNFQYDRSLFKNDDMLLPHSDHGKNLIAQIPKVYYAQDDDIRMFSERDFSVNLHPKDYRSIHYILSYHKAYVELQVRTIYDEAWSDCDHNYVYKQDTNHSHSALAELSGILCRLTNISNDMGETMKEIFEEQSYTDMGNGFFETDAANIKKVDIELEKLYDISKKLEQFRSHIAEKSEASNHGKSKKE